MDKCFCVIAIRDEQEITGLKQCNDCGRELTYEELEQNEKPKRRE